MRKVVVERLPDGRLRLKIVEVHK
ncbi:hypothetical protein HWB39_gp47 [Streptomyces phage WRightOn]|uniref:Uncharacterized protein n=1 Tax=Streptomyces phage WRightOn TaxID=2053723 RepID=A0A2H4PI60_9CAUD|nr:hypothetical protein HWB39_gp47 [Streptomyces phage WRightOn]ATW62489.1 hypothetical protein SEA_WRIGHTON_55 [Streptomyces phage WRightOn]